MVLGLLGETAAKLVGEAPPPENAITLLPRMGEKPVLETELRNARKSNAVRIVRVQVYSKLFESALGYFFLQNSQLQPQAVAATSYQRAPQRVCFAAVTKCTFTPLRAGAHNPNCLGRY